LPGRVEDAAVPGTAVGDIVPHDTRKQPARSHRREAPAVGLDKTIVKVTACLWLVLQTLPAYAPTRRDARAGDMRPPRRTRPPPSS
jgi:hypothetical protein